MNIATGSAYVLGMDASIRSTITRRADTSSGCAHDSFALSRPAKREGSNRRFSRELGERSEVEGQQAMRPPRSLLDAQTN